jgi:hypothetical protein
MRFDQVPAQEEVEQIREACAELGSDEEMTALILSSYRRDRTLPILETDDHENVREYVCRKLAVWKNIFESPI